jgi:glycosyltransferase involved in cell wall biosynthesis
MLMPNIEPSSSEIQIIIDATHLSKQHITGIERITLELFSKHTMQPLNIRMVEAKSRLHMMWQQNITLPIMALKMPHTLFITPGFPPSLFLSLFGKRVIPYIHDVFLITRWRDLGFIGKFYMSAPFKRAVASLPRFFVNSDSTRQELREFCRPDAEIILYRPPVRNVFSLIPKAKPHAKSHLKLVTLGTVEPRKNLTSATNILAELRAGAYPNATLDIVGKIGWGGEADKLKNIAGVNLHGYKSASEIKTILEGADCLISTSHNEGLGLPLLEAQYAGLPIIAPDLPVFREVLDKSGVFINPDDSQGAAQIITSLLNQPDWYKTYAALAKSNLQRWNTLAASDHVQVIALLVGS